MCEVRCKFYIQKARFATVVVSSTALFWPMALSSFFDASLPLVTLEMPEEEIHLTVSQNKPSDEELTDDELEDVGEYKVDELVKAMLFEIQVGVAALTSWRKYPVYLTLCLFNCTKYPYSTQEWTLSPKLYAYSVHETTNVKQVKFATMKRQDCKRHPKHLCNPKRSSIQCLDVRLCGCV